MKYDYIIVGSGFFGSICAYELNKKGHKCLVLEKRNHIGGNCYTRNKNGINIHEYGPHIFHTSDKEIWDWINQFTSFNDFTFRPVANYKNEIYSLPFNMWTFSKLWGITRPNEAKYIIKEQSKGINEPTNLEEQAIKFVGKDVYEKLIKGYTEKQWRKPAVELPKEIIKRLPVRFTYDNNYFNDKYQGIPIGGYTQIFEKLLEGIEVKLETDYLQNKEYWNEQGNHIIYTGPIDAFYDYIFGELEYKTTRFEHFEGYMTDFQGTSVVNYTDIDVPFTRTIEHKHFDKDDKICNLNYTYITYEYPTEYIVGKTEPMYPVNDDKNNAIYNMYSALGRQEKRIIFGGRLAEYKYYDMHQVIKSALNFINKL